jgi:hypothetical protein
MADAPQIGRTGRSELLLELERAKADIVTLRAECDSRVKITAAEADAFIMLMYDNDIECIIDNHPSCLPAWDALSTHAKGGR